MALAHECVQWLALVLEVLHIRVRLSERKFMFSSLKLCGYVDY
jgi:hypothetical protein